MATEQELAQALGPAFGIYPKAFRGNTGNPQDAANLPVNVMRGRTAGLLGMFGDVVNQPSAFTPVRAVQLAMQGVMGQDKYPDTEHFLKTLPLKPTSKAGEVAGQAASFVPLNPAPAVRAAKAGVQALGPTASNMAEDFLMRRGLMPSVVEPPKISNAIEQRPALPSDYYELNGLATQAYTDLRAKPSLETKNRYMEIIAARDEAVNNPSKNYQPPIPDAVPENYKGQHAAPTKGAGAPVWDLKGVYPDDFYSFNGAKYYGDGAEPVRDLMIVSQMQSMKGRPNADVTIYRAVPKSVSAKEALNVGDWITLDRRYAKEHGESALNNDYKIVSKKVKARDLYTNGDSIYEMGYDPQPREKSAK